MEPGQTPFTVLLGPRFPLQGLRHRGTGLQLECSKTVGSGACATPRSGDPGNAISGIVTRHPVRGGPDHRRGGGARFGSPR
jgi:hypothetical protein